MDFPLVRIADGDSTLYYTFEWHGRAAVQLEWREARGARRDDLLLEWAAAARARGLSSLEEAYLELVTDRGRVEKP